MVGNSIPSHAPLVAGGSVSNPHVMGGGGLFIFGGGQNHFICNFEHKSKYFLCFKYPAMARLFTAMAFGFKKTGVMSRLFVPGTEQLRLERGRSCKVSNRPGGGGGGVTPGRPWQCKLALSQKAALAVACIMSQHLAVPHNTRPSPKSNRSPDPRICLTYSPSNMALSGECSTSFLRQFPMPPCRTFPAYTPGTKDAVQAR